MSFCLANVCWVVSIPASHIALMVPLITHFAAENLRSFIILNLLLKRGDIRQRWMDAHILISPDREYGLRFLCLTSPWASYQIRKIAGCACAGNAGNVFPRRRFQRKPIVGDPGMHHGTCVTHVPWCMSGSLTCGDGENVPGIPCACAPAILRIWQEAHWPTTTLKKVQLLWQK